MIIELNGKYKSLNSFKSEELNDFVLITGKNGSGKTHLINLLTSYNHTNNDYKIDITPTPKNLQSEGIVLNDIQKLEGEKLNQQLNHSFSSYQSIDHLKYFVQELLDNGLNPINITKDLDFTIYMNEKDNEKANQDIRLICNRFLGGEDRSYDSNNNREVKNLKNRNKISERLYEWRKGIICGKYVSEYKLKKFKDLEKNDFNSTPMLETYYTNDSPFNAQIENIFYGYARKRLTNEIEYNRKLNHNKENNSVSDKEFIERFPPPWEVINRVLTKHNLKLRVVVIEPEDFSPEYEFLFYLIDVTNNEKITFGNLSSGEKIIVGLVIRLFLTEQYKQEFKFPDLLLFDEPDAYLHPEMSSLLLEVLFKTFTKELGIKVIITTHSPSTVALAPEESIYELKNGTNTSLKKVSKDEALKILTQNLPLLSIDYRNHRQVFVESPTDQFYYQSIFNKLKTEKQTIFDLYFITTGYGKANSDQVVKLTKEIRDAGNRTSYGIIDWDGKNNSEDFIKVHGHNKRYSVENFLLDPIYLCILFLEQGITNNINELGFDKTYNQYKIFEETDARLNEIIDWFFSKIILKFKTLRFENFQELEYLSGKKIKIPQWYLNMQGHELEGKLREVFASLKQFTNEGDLQKKLTEISGKCFPFISLETADLLKELSGYNNSSS